MKDGTNRMNSFKEYIDLPWQIDGQSAKCLYGVHIKNFIECNYPHDPDDLCRVIQVLRLVFPKNAKELMQECANHYNSQEWGNLCNNWDKLLKIFAKEWDNKSAPRTYKSLETIYSGGSL